MMRAALALIVALATAASSPALPGTAAGTMLGAWLAAFNSGDPATYRAFTHASFPSREKNFDADMAFRTATGGFDLRKIEESTATSVTALVQERASDQFGRLVLEVSAAEPHAIDRLSVRAIPRPAEFPIEHLTDTELRAAAERQAQAASAAGTFSGAVLVAKNGRPLFAKAYGLADRDRKVPNKLETRFRIGSMNKMFTAVATLQLLQAGKIRLTDSVGTFLPDYPNKDVASKVTVRQLLTHTGGTGDIFGPEYTAHRLELRTIADYVALYGARAPLFEPGSKFAYSNYGFVLLGAIVEKASGQNYYDYVREHVYAPAGMTATGSEPESVAVPNRAVGYTDDDGRVTPNTDTLPYRCSPA
ncbi:MAG TPA: serine hydrolase domain-containing protein, partial [Candidatus Elarobacter sp.]|nr:serine hydrolase domain-containing protein [Candidatus Elarobacter sp.]